ncbi:cation:proton antiporter [Crocosphaera chwakensis]|uniref:Putative potassium-efflux system protein n=1 Tax=Crocosphaera chwakensis CCY0110 TaxID=391612 RepID=A3IR47_9CHRO|nr:cation:proton antiporter [Crocosphaera chwakensis]EAZ91037.1 putative potassium-efflux system protein [Crocosphaera chwakensis CCY0110]
MTNLEQNLPLIILLIGVIIILSILTKFGLQRFNIPILVGYLCLGLLLRIIEDNVNLLADAGLEIIKFLADVGLICLLFRVGLESDLGKLIQQLRRASLVWLGDVAISGMAGFVIPVVFLQLDIISSLFIATAMTATSVGISVSIWQEAQALNSPNGELMLDVAEMDDISAIFLMALLFNIVPVIHNGSQTNLDLLIFKTVVLFIFKAIFFAGFCFFFSRYLESHITAFFRKFDPPADFTLTIVGFGFLIAAIAGLLGFSQAVGAFFAGLVFSRDPEAVKIDASFEMLYDLFVPFFFISIGLAIDVTTLGNATVWGTILLIGAVLGKLIGAGLPTFLMTGWHGSIIIGLSMVPRAEIMMVVMQRGLHLGEWAVSTHIFSAMIFVSSVTCVVTPLILRSLLKPAD